MEYLVYLLNTLSLTFDIILSYWWIWAPIILFMVFWGSLEAFNKAKYIAGLKWVLLEIKFPEETHKSLKAMEQIFVDLHSSGPPPKTLMDKFNRMRDRVFKGKVGNWYSFEIVGDAAEIRFYIRCVEDSRDLVEAQIYGHYPDAEITQVADYVTDWPLILPNEEFDVNGAELGLVKENVVPLKTYPEFEEEHAGREDVRRIDPLAPLIQAISLLGFAERVGIQLLIRPTGGDWPKKDPKNQKFVDKLFEKPEKPEVTAADKIFGAIEGVAGSIAGVTPEEKKEEKKEAKAFNQLPPGTQELIKAIEHHTSKLAFESGIRIFYMARREAFNKAKVGSVMAAFKQFSSAQLNSFKPDFSPDVKKGRHKEERTVENKVKLADHFRRRDFPDKPFILNTEELTTIWHFPDVGVKTPALPRVEAKKGEPPAGLPTV